MTRITLRKRTLAIPFALFLAASSGTLGAEPTLPQRLAKLTENLEEQRQAFHVPGMAMVVVQGDSVIYKRAFGLADLENDVAATPETVFAIGSSTKAFTASLVGMLVDEGKMDWDDPVTAFLPDFKLKIDSDDPEARVTIRDLLAHRTGFTRMGMLYANGAASPEEVLRMATRAEPWAPFRQQFHYSNVGFTAVGAAVGVVAKSSWDALLAQRILTPLGMTSTSVARGEVQRDTRMSRGYRWNQETEAFEALPPRSLDGIAPAGAIHSNAVDMAQWLRFQLGHGAFDGRVLLSEVRHGEAWSKQIEIAPGMNYGQGWFLRDVAGHKVVEHGGNVDGFSTAVGLFPDADLGFALLTNANTSPLPGHALRMVADALLNEWPEVEATAVVAGNLDEYVGDYAANFAPFDGAQFTVAVNGEHLTIDVPGQTTYQLEPPNDEGKWYFSITDQIAISFDREDGGSVVGLTMHQAGMALALPKEGVERRPEIALSKLEAYLGTYRCASGKRDFEVKISNQRLAIDIPGQMLHELLPPNEDHRWISTSTDRVSAQFNRSDDGSVASMKLYRDGEQWIDLARVQNTDAIPLPTIEEVVALARRTGGRAEMPFRISGRVRFVHAGLTGQLIYTSDGEGSHRSDMNLGRFGWSHDVATEDQAWSESDFHPLRQLRGKFRTQAQVAQALLLPGDWLTLFDAITVTGTETLDDRLAYLLQLRVGELPAIKASIDAETGDLLRLEMSVLDPDSGISFPVVTQQEDFREIGGVRVAFRSVSRNPFTGETVFEVENVETDVAIDQRLFAPPGSFPPIDWEWKILFSTWR